MFMKTSFSINHLWDPQFAYDYQICHFTEIPSLSVCSTKISHYPLFLLMSSLFIYKIYVTKFFNTGRKFCMETNVGMKESKLSNTARVPPQSFHFTRGFEWNYPINENDNQIKYCSNFYFQFNLHLIP